jgi:hypothetical protein
MMKWIIILLTVGLTGCNEQPKQATAVSTLKKDATVNEAFVWTKLLDSADWKKSYNFQMFVFHDTMWNFHHDGTWYSTNGKQWAKSPLKNAINNLAFLDYVQFENAVYGLGHFEGNIENYIFRGEIYRTTDCKSWTTISKNSNLPTIFFYHPFVFNHKIWIVGGEDKNTQYSDIWNSPDGIYWTKQKSNLPFGKRSKSEIVFFNNKLFLLNNDVWSSTDGLTWTQETNEIVKGETIFGYTALVFDNKIWLLGCNRNGQFKSEVFVSSDGKNWEGQEAPWSPRGGIAATVYKGKLYMTGGKYGGLEENGITTEFIYSNDVWVLEKKE